VGLKFSEMELGG